MIGVSKIEQVDDRTIGITWTDGQRQLLDTVHLRRQCPCASCVNEWTGERNMGSREAPDTVRPRSIESVGRYAMQIKFSDGHNTGFYTFDYLRGLAGGKK